MRMERSPMAWILAILSVCLFLVGMLTMVKPPTNGLWKLSIVVLEGGHFLAPACLVLALWCFLRGGATLVPGALFLLSAALYLSPALRASAAASRLEKAFARDWESVRPPEGRAFGRVRPLSWIDLARGVPVPALVPKTMVYRAQADGDLELDYYPAAPSGKGRSAPCVVVIHGGGWDSGDRGQLATLNRYLAGHGYAVASIDYSLAPAHRYPAPVADANAALDFLIARAGELGLDPSRFVLLGRSAGGQIALQAAYLNPRGSIKGVIAFYAPADMVFGYGLPTNPLIMDSRKIMEAYLGGGYSDVPGAYHASSPFEQASSQSPPTLLLHGRPDVLVSYRHTLHLRERLGILGVRHFVVDIPWGAHGFDYVFRGPGSQIGLYFIERFLAEVAG